MSVFLIDVQNDHDYLVSEDQLQTAAIAVLKRHDVPPDASLSVVITTSEAVQTLNKQFRGVDAPTDVLSFPADAPPIQTEDEPPYLGDLIIAFPYAEAQATREKHPLQDSLALLVVHGTLHLLGYDHDTPENRAEMWQVQAAVLQELAIDTRLVPALEDALDDH
jgi:probable rRNA maturation factor